MIKQTNPDQKIKKIKLILKSLDSESFIKTYKELSLILGSATSLYLSCLIDKYNYFENRSMLVDGEYFYTTKNWIEFETGLAQTNQSKHSEKLEQLGLIKVKYILKPREPRRKYYTINDDVLEELLKKMNVLKHVYLSEEGKIFINDNNFKKYKEALKEVTINGKNPYTMESKYPANLKLLNKKESENDEIGVHSDAECSGGVQTLNEGAFRRQTDVHSNAERQIRLSNKNKENKTKNIKENSEEFPGESFKEVPTGGNTVEKFKGLKKEYSKFEEKLYKEFSPVLKEFSDFGFSLKFNKGSSTPEYLYNHFTALSAGEFKQKLKSEQLEKLKDYKKLDTPQPIDRLAKYIHKALTTYETIRTDPAYWPPDKAKLKRNISEFMLSQNKFSWLFYCLSDPQPVERQDYQIAAIRKKFEGMKINDQSLLKKLYNNHVDAHRFDAKQWQEVYFSLDSIMKYIGKYEAELTAKNAYETLQSFIELMANWNLTQSKMQSNFKVTSAPWQWFNDWLKRDRGFDMRVDGKKVMSAVSLKRDIENQAISFFTSECNSLFDGEGRKWEFKQIEIEARKRTLAKFPGVNAEKLVVEVAE